MKDNFAIKFGNNIFLNNTARALLYTVYSIGGVANTPYQSTSTIYPTSGEGAM